MPAKAPGRGRHTRGFDAELDRLRSLSRDNMAWLAELEQAEQKRTGIRNLRIKYNGAFGYFIEVTKANLGSVPPEYIRRQTMVNCDRFTTQELREKEREILHSQEYALAREQELFSRIVARALSFAPLLRRRRTFWRASTFSGAGRKSRASGTIAAPLWTTPTPSKFRRDATPS